METYVQTTKHFQNAILRINCWIARPAAQPICPWGVLWICCNSTEWGSPLFQLEDKDLFYVIYGCVREKKEGGGGTYFLAPAVRQRKDTYTPNTRPVHMSYNRALDRTAHAGSLLDSGGGGGGVQSFPQPQWRDQESGLNLGWMSTVHSFVGHLHGNITL